MSINILNEAHNAVVELRASRDFERLLVALGELARTRMIGAMNSPVDHRTDATAYARGMYDLWEAMESARLGVQISQVKPPPLGKRMREDANA